MKAFVWSANKNKKVKTITGTNNNNGHFWNKFNNYCKEKGYTKKIESGQYTGSIAWQNNEGDILEFKWEREVI